MAGEVMGLLGPNGSGKTTILRVLTGYLRPSAGSVSLAGIDVLSAPLATRRLVGYVPEDAPLYNSMRVREFLSFMAKLKGVRRKEVRPAVGAVSERLGLVTVGDRLIGTLSRGFRQRVAIAQALLNHPPVLVLDEPTNGLDPHQIIEVRDLIRSLAGAHTVLVTSHILPEMSRVADRVAILLEGRVLKVEALRGGSRRRLRLRVRGDEQAVLSCLRAMPATRAVTSESQPGDPSLIAYSVDIAAGPYVAEELAASLFRGGFAIAELTDAGMDLERLFLDLTRDRSTQMP